MAPEITEQSPALLEIAHSWHADFYNNLTNAINHNESFDNVADIIWENGILDRVAPKDPAVKEARERSGKIVYPGERDEAALYLRLMYSAKNFYHNADFLIRTSNKSFVAALFESLELMSHSSVRDRFFGDKDDLEATQELVNAIAQRAEEELEKNSESLPILSERQVVKFFDRNVEIIGFSEQGDVMIKVLKWTKDLNFLNGQLAEVTDANGNPCNHMSYIPLEYFYAHVSTIEE